MTLAIDTVDGCDLSNKECRELLPKKTNAALAIHFTIRAVLPAAQY